MWRATPAAATAAGVQNGPASSPMMRAFSERWTALTARGTGGCSPIRSMRLRFDTEEEAEYPWDFCMAYAAGLKVALDKRAPQPVGLVARDHLMAVYSACKRATKGLQRETVAMAVAASVNDMLKQMQPGREAQHLAS